MGITLPGLSEASPGATRLCRLQLRAVLELSWQVIWTLLQVQFSLCVLFLVFPILSAAIHGNVLRHDLSISLATATLRENSDKERLWKRNCL
jgi:hypothetical protein